MATSTSSIPLVSGPLANAEGLDATIHALRARFPGAIIDRYLDKIPTIGQRVLIAPGAAVVAETTLGDDVSIWYGAVLRGDMAPVSVGARSNIQDGSVLHVGDFSPCVVGEDVVVGHRAVLHGCKIDNRCLIGMQATILDDAVIGQGSIVGAGALVTQRTVIPPCSLVLGAPAKVVKSLGDASPEDIAALAGKYTRLKENFLRDAFRAV